ncbi:MAG TPA: ECF-type sigma factor [Candidatus Polarisedimenticolaceae bacterium]|nr:ECF-type sigma factor [Candidatus Polarisedimenticolaceae bacterium]
MNDCRASAGAARLLPLVYGNLRALACRYLQAEGYHTLQPTALVHEAYLRLARREEIDWQGQTHFLAVAATEMRRILVDHARSSGAAKRGGEATRIPLSERSAIAEEPQVRVLALEEALGRLAARSPRQARVVEMRVFAGMLAREIGEVLGVSVRTVNGDWRVARAWLARELRSERPA